MGINYVLFTLIMSFAVVMDAFSINIFARKSESKPLAPLPSPLHYSADDIDPDITQDRNQKDPSSPQTEFAVLSVGCPVEIQVGDLDLTRKAWKKRRRSGSPMLVPCSILNVDRKAMIVNNIVFLLHKFGKPLMKHEMLEQPEGFNAHHIAISFPEINQRYKSHLRASLSSHASDMGYETSSNLIQDLMTTQLQQQHGIKLWTDGKQFWIVSRISRMKGHRLAALTPLLQFIQDRGNSVMMHTGMLRIKTDERPGSFSLQPVSAALRVSQRAIDTGLVATGSSHFGTFLGIDPMGDGGFPVMKFSLNVPSDHSSKKATQPSFESLVGLQPLVIDFKDLKAGQGPFSGKVVHVSQRAGAAFIDLGVGRHLNSQSNGQKGMIRVLGMLRLDDFSQLITSTNPEDNSMNEDHEEVPTVENVINLIEYKEDDDISQIDDQEESLTDILNNINIDDFYQASQDEDGEEIEEDISHLVTFQDGKYSFHDPDSGEVIELNGLLGDDDGFVFDSDEEVDILSHLTPDQRLSKISESMNGNEGSQLRQRSVTPKVGDTVEVYVLAVSKQSRRFMLTTHKSMKMKILKQEKKSNKNIERLASKFGGNINNIKILSGNEGIGIVTAISKTGEWLYVKPQFNDLPVGIATIASELDFHSLSKGDSVQIRVDGVDETRGQLSMTVLKKN
jgi:hypothetical protein